MGEIKTPPKKLVDLRPEWLSREGVEKYAIRFDCPCGTAPHPHSADSCSQPDCPFDHGPGCEYGRMTIYFENPVSGKSLAPKGHETWKRTGEQFDELTLSPSLHAVGHWHGHCREGVLKSC